MSSQDVHRDTDVQDAGGGDFDVAIVGMAGRFPGADDLETFWANLRAGKDCITFFSREELVEAGIPPEVVDDPHYVRAMGTLRDVEHFDAAFFGYSPREAEILEPGHRLFLECAWEAMEDAGYHPHGVDGSVGVYAGAGSSGYAEGHVLPNAEVMAAVGYFQANLASSKDFLATRTSYKLDLRGPSLGVQTGCSTSLVAVHLAAQSLLRGECDLALAGGTSVIVPQKMGYAFAPGSIVSPDGHCRAFDADSAGAVSGSGAAVVVLKRLSDALRDGDAVRAVIRGSAVNNDGATKVAYTAPAVEGQAAVIGEALAAADVEPDSISYVEAHGTGTDLGDVIEIGALTQAFRAGTERVGFCTVGSVKASIGHLDTAAGIAGLVKTVLALEHRELPPTAHFRAPNPRIPFAGSPFVVRPELRPWESGGGPRRAGVSSFGIGGTNAHVVLEEAPAPAPSGPSRPHQLLVLSARSRAALDAATARLADHLVAHPELPLADVAFTLREGRRPFAHRRSLVVREGEDAAALLRGAAPDRVATATAPESRPSVAFLFPGLGDHYPQMGRGLYEAEPVFRAEVDRCAEILRPLLGMDVREALFPGDAPADAAGGGGGLDLRRMLGRGGADPDAERLNRTEVAQPAVFVVGWALAKLWESWGVRPEAVIGHSLGEYTAACVAGILSLDDALAVVAARARAIAELPPGAMLAVPMDPEAVRPRLDGGVAVATVNAPGLTVVAGPVDAVEALEARLTAEGVAARRLPTTHAFHSPMMEPAAARLTEIVGRVRLRAPSIPMVSNVSGTWITDAEATDPAYWTRHVLGTVRFAEGVGALLETPGRVLLEVGPGQTLGTFVRQRQGGESVPVVGSMRAAFDRRPDAAVVLEALGRLWAAGVAPDWAAFRAGERRRRVHLPTYPWERRRFWIEAPRPGTAPAAPSARADAAAVVDSRSPASWPHLPVWTRAAAAAAEAPERVLLVSDGGVVAEGVAAALEHAGSRVTVARAGSAFGRGGRGFTVRPQSREDHRALAAALRDEGAPEVVVHAGGVEGWAGAALGGVLHLAEAFAADGARLLVLTGGGQDVSGDEPLEPTAAAVAALARVVAQEHPPLRCRVVDLPAGAGADAVAALAARVAAEAAVDDDAPPVVALRGRHRWVRGFRAARAESPAARLREGGAYLLVGGVRGRNGALAAALARTPGVRLALVDPALEDADTLDGWSGRLAADDPGRAVAEALRAAGAEVLLHGAGPADAPALTAAVAAAEARFGRLDGVACAPALDVLPELAPLAEADVYGWLNGLAGIRGQLEALDAALAGRALDFRLVESSLTGVLGGVGRGPAAAANAVVEAFAQARPGWTAVAWDRWAMAAAAPDGEPGWVLEGDVPAALESVLALAAEPAVYVSTSPLEARIRDAGRAAAPAARPDVAESGHARPELGTEYHAAETEVEARLVAMWQELLGIRTIGIHDDFFALGGHSLMATQIISRVREIFQVQVSLAAIFEAPTVARFAALIEDAIIAELEDLTDEEAMALLE